MYLLAPVGHRCKKVFFACDEIYKFEFCTWLFEFCTWIFDCFPENSHIIEKLPWILNCFTKIHIKNTIFSVSWRALTRARFFCTWVKWFCMWWHHSHSGFFAIMLRTSGLWAWIARHYCFTLDSPKQRTSCIFSALVSSEKDIINAPFVHGSSSLHGNEDCLLLIWICYLKFESCRSVRIFVLFCPT